MLGLHRLLVLCFARVTESTGGRVHAASPAGLSFDSSHLWTLLFARITSLEGPSLHPAPGEGRPGVVEQGVSHGGARGCLSGLCGRRETTPPGLQLRGGVNVAAKQGLCQRHQLIEGSCSQRGGWSRAATLAPAVLHTKLQAQHPPQQLKGKGSRQEYTCKLHLRWKHNQNPSSTNSVPFPSHVPNYMVLVMLWV